LTDHCIVEVMFDPSPTPSHVLGPVSFKNDWPIATWKDTRLTRNPSPHYTNSIADGFLPYSILVCPWYLLFLFLSL